VAWLGAACLLAAPAAADDPAPVAAQPAPAAPPAEEAGPPTVDAVAGKVVQALKAKDDAALEEAIAEGGVHDLWLVVDAVVARGEAEAAASFAEFLVKASGTTEFARAPEYVAARKGASDDAENRKVAAAAEAALEKGDAEGALRALEGVLEGLHGVTAVRVLEARGDALAALGKAVDAAHALGAAAESAHAIGWDNRALSVYQRAASSSAAVADFPAAISAYRAARSIAEAAKMEEEARRILVEIVVLEQKAGRHEKALETADRALEEIAAARKAAGDAEAGKAPGAGTEAYAEARVREAVGLVHFDRGDDGKALESLSRAMTIYDRGGFLVETSTVLSSLGNVHAGVARYEDALACYQRALGIRRGLGPEYAGAVGKTLNGIGLVHANCGRYDQAFASLEEAVAVLEKTSDRVNTAIALGNLGLVHGRISNFRLALEFHERALAVKREIGDRRQVALTLDNIGRNHAALGALDKATEFHEQALGLAEDGKDRAQVAWTLGNLGLVRAAKGKRAIEEGDEPGGMKLLAEAVDFHRRALEIGESMKDGGGIARSLEKLGRAHAALGESKEALATLDRAIAAAESLRSNQALFQALEASAGERLRAGQPRTAKEQARRAVELLPTLVRGLGDEEGAAARETQAAVFGVGTLAAARSNDPEEAAYFVESGRAGNLLETLGGRDELREAVLSPELANEEARARAEMGRAQEAYAKAVSGGDRAEIRRRGDGLDGAMRRLSEVIEKIQRVSKRQAKVLYATVDALGAVAARLKPDEALVEYALCDPDAIALVVTPAGGKVVVLGKTEDLVEACDGIACDDADEDPSEALAAVAKALLEPLGLEAGVRRILVSPEGDLGYVPFSALRTDLEFVSIPSGTAYGFLREEGAKPGEGILAIGDPSYGAPGDPSGPAIVVRGGPLTPLPSTREEAKAIGDTVLLGKEATEAGLRAALAKKDRWRAVHFACHGLVDAERPKYSSLALTPTATDDGLFRAEEIVKTRFAADLVVMSACDTSRGKVVQGEGILGLTRAFLVAGAPRIICSLWKVDDEATRALMVKFHGVWKSGKPAATALREAQAFVRSQEKWKHPNYWAAWVLWGLPD
jgi:tetratricopeptide (TPR) repeat protein